MQVWVKALALGINPGDAVAFHNVVKFPFGHLHAIEKTLQRFVCLSGFFRHVFDRPCNVVGDRENVAGKTGDCEFGCIRLVAFGAPAQVLHFGSGSEQPIFQLCVLLTQCFGLTLSPATWRKFTAGSVGDGFSIGRTVT